MMSTLARQPDEILNRLASIGMVAAHVPGDRMPGSSINTVFRLRTLAGEPVVFRLGPSRADVASGPTWMHAEALACEAIVLDRVRASIPWVPVTLAAGFRDSARAWLVQSVVPGRPLDIELPGMTATQREGIWREIGRLARQLHGVHGEWFGTPDGRRVYPDWAAMVRADAEGLRDDAVRYGLDLVPFDRLLTEVEAHVCALQAVRQPAVVHSDLDPRHIFVRRRGEDWAICGVIDWEYARYVDPWSESLLVGLLARPEDDPERVAFLAGYGFDPGMLADPAFLRRQRIYQGIARGWALTDAARLEERVRARWCVAAYCR